MCPCPCCVLCVAEQIKALTAVAKLCSMDTANILLVEWANGCEVICNTIKARLMVKEVVVSRSQSTRPSPLPVNHSHAHDR